MIDPFFLVCGCNGHLLRGCNKGHKPEIHFEAARCHMAKLEKFVHERRNLTWLGWRQRDISWRRERKRLPGRASSVFGRIRFEENGVMCLVGRCHGVLLSGADRGSGDIVCALRPFSGNTM
jgi:hypothetical protein